MPAGDGGAHTPVRAPNRKGVASLFAAARSGADMRPLRERDRWRWFWRMSACRMTGFPGLFLACCFPTPDSWPGSGRGGGNRPAGKRLKTDRLAAAAGSVRKGLAGAFGKSDHKNGGNPGVCDVFS